MEFIDASNLTDQAFLLEWAELGTKAYCPKEDCEWTMGCLKRAKERLADLARAYMELSEEVK